MGASRSVFVCPSSLNPLNSSQPAVSIARTESLRHGPYMCQAAGLLTFEDIARYRGRSAHASRPFVVPYQAAQLFAKLQGFAGESALKG
jgi:hypothetical protein